MRSGDGWFRPLGAWFVVAPAVMIVVVVLAGTWEMLSWPYPVWVQASAHWHQQFVFAGPVAGAVAAWWAARLNRADRVWSQSPSPRLGAVLVTRHLTVLTGWLVGAYVLGLLPLTVATALNGGIGVPRPWVMVSGVLAMVAATAAGYLVGTLAGSLVVVPFVAVALYVLDAFAAYGADTVGAVVPQLYTDPVLGVSESAGLVVFRIAWFSAVAAASAALAARVLRGRATGRYSSRPAAVRDGAVSAAAPVVLVVAALVTTPDLFEIEASARDRTCRHVDGVEYCVHRDNADRMDDLVGAFDGVLTRYGAEPPGIGAVWDRTLVLERGGSRADGMLTARIVPDGSVYGAASMVTALVGVYECDSAAAPGALPVLSDLADYLSDGTLGGTLSGMDRAEVRGWIGRHRHALADCTLGSGDLPTA